MPNLLQRMPSKALRLKHLLDFMMKGQAFLFIARYRKEHTGGLDDEILRELEKSLIIERDLAARRQKS